MIEEQASVVSIDGDFVWVESIRLSTCNSCSAQKGCGQSVISKAVGQQRQQFKVLLNNHHLQVGEEITIAMPDEAFLKLSLLVYFIPLLGLMLGAITGFSLMGEGMSILLGGGGLAGGLFILRVMSQKFSRDPDYQPQVLYRQGSGQYQPLKIIE